MPPVVIAVKVPLLAPCHDDGQWLVRFSVTILFLAMISSAISEP
jgi:hypothetical protein